MAELDVEGETGIYQVDRHEQRHQGGNGPQCQDALDTLKGEPGRRWTARLITF